MDPVRSSESAFTLIEFLVAIVILMVGMLGLLQMVNVALSQSLQNQLRNEAVIVLDTEMAMELAKGYELVDISTTNYPITRKVLGNNKQYLVARSGTSFSNSRQVNFQVSWLYKGVSYTHNASSVLTKSTQ